MEKKQSKWQCPRCGTDIIDDSGYCSKCGATVQKISDIKKSMSEYQKSYNKLKRIGENISGLCIALGIVMILGIFPTMIDNGPVFTLIFAIIMTFLSGSAIKHYFNCTSEMAKNIEKQTELLEKLNEKLDK